MSLLRSLFLLLVLSVSPYMLACSSHYYAPGIELSGSHLVKLNYPSFAMASVGVEHSISVSFNQSDKNEFTQIELIGTKNISFSKTKYEIKGTQGQVEINFTLTQFGFALVQLKVSGTQQGKAFVETNKLFVQVKK